MRVFLCVAVCAHICVRVIMVWQLLTESPTWGKWRGLKYDSRLLSSYAPLRTLSPSLKGCNYHVSCRAANMKKIARANYSASVSKKRENWEGDFIEKLTKWWCQPEREYTHSVDPEMLTFQLYENTIMLLPTELRLKNRCSEMWPCSLILTKGHKSGQTVQLPPLASQLQFHLFKVGQYHFSTLKCLRMNSLLIIAKFSYRFWSVWTSLVVGC